MPIEISRLTEQDIPEAIECVQKGFADDPYFLWQFDASKFSKERNASSMWNRYQWGINNALIYVAKEVGSQRPPEGNGPDTKTQSSPSPSPSRVVGVSFWLPPKSASETETWSSYLQSWVLTIRQTLTNIRFLGRGGLVVKRYWIWKAGQEKVQSELWTDSRGYYFCNVVAVLPGQQGKGIGRKLVEVVTEQADREGMNCYLESSKNVPNVQIYESFGFKLVRDMACDDDGVVCKLYCMTREPKLPH